MNNAEVVTLLKSIRACEPAIQWVIEHGGDADALLRDASEEYLAFIIYYAPDEYKARASDALLARDSVSEGVLRVIIRYAPDEYKARAWDALMTRYSVSELALRDIICYAPDEYKARARAVLNERDLK